MGGGQDYDPRLRNVTSRQICASLLLQQLLYYQLFFSIAWLLFWNTWLFYTYWRGLFYRDGDIGRTVLMVFWSLAEPARLAAGWNGNLQENVPWLVLFCILTFIPTHATVYYMLLGSTDTRAYHQAVQVTQAILLELELLVGMYAVRRMYRLQKQQYYLFEYAMGQRRRAQQPEQLVQKQQPRLARPGGSQPLSS
ncbi:hypothetical protein V8C86DRAFT_2609369 [Haematococcus lacustris]